DYYCQTYDSSLNADVF
nr:immunoglobulin light chain junction region [Macaca mulatta]MOY16596.1 immunoglobulin light chain junction region [Macaca mulatta]MOY16843.1 immunoglobulin light chain junction region [Macaca mulatta]